MSAAADSSTEDSREKVDSYRLGKEYEVPHPKTRAFMVEDAQWERIQGRVASLEAKDGIDWLIALATMVGGIAASAVLALIALPNATKEGGELSPFVKPTLWVVFIGGAIVAVALALAWKHLKDNKTKTASDICAEMTTIQEAWKERKSSSTPAVEAAD
jgi:hypothetical protein